MTVVINGTTGITTPTTNSTGEFVTSVTGFKNRIINGAMAIDQRNAGAAISLSNSYAYDVDRWWCQNANVGTAQQVSTGDSDFPYALRLKRTSGNTGTSIVTCGQVIESVNCKDLAGQSVTISMYLTAGANFSAASSQVYLSIITGTGTDQGALSGFGNATWTGWANTLASAQTISTTRTKYTATVTIPAGTNEIGARIYWYPTGTAGAADYVDVTGFQLEKGSTATSFDYRPYGTELALCQRYYFKMQADDTAYVFSPVSADSATRGYATGTFPVTLRTTPSALEQSGTASQYTVRTGGADRASSAVPAFASTTTQYVWVVETTVASGQTAGLGGIFYGQSTSAYLGWSAEL